MNADCFLSTMSINPMVNSIIERLISENSSELDGLEESLKNSCILKHKDLIMEVLKED